MEAISRRVAEKYLLATRPTPIDREEIKSFVTNKLVPAITRWLKRQVQDQPLGAVSGIVEDDLKIESVDGKETLRASVLVQSKAATGKWASVLGGSSGYRRWQGGEARVNITLWLNGALSPADYFDTDPMKGNRLSPLSACTHEHCLPYGLYSILTHEVTHAAESMFTGKQPTYYQQGPGGQEVADEVAYVNDPKEVRAFMQQVVDEVVRMAKKDMIRDHVKTDRALVDLCLQLSTTWMAIDKHLLSSNRAKILKAVYDGLDKEGLLH